MAEESKEKPKLKLSLRKGGETPPEEQPVPEEPAGEEPVPAPAEMVSEEPGPPDMSFSPPEEPQPEASGQDGEGESGHDGPVARDVPGILCDIRARGAGGGEIAVDRR